MKKLVLIVSVIALLLIGGAALAQDDASFTVWHIQNTGAGPELFEGAAERFMADNPGVTVELLPMQNDPFKERIRTAIGAGDEPCIFPSWGGGPMLEYVDAGVLASMTDYFEEDNYKDFFLPASFSNVTGTDGNIYGFPAENVVVAGFFYDRAIFEEYGLEPPETWEELMAIAETLKENGIATFSLAGASKWTSSMYYMYLVDRLAGPGAFAAAAARDGSFEAEPFVRAGEIIQEMVENGYFVEGFNGLDYDTGQSRIPMYAGQAAMELIGSWSIQVVKGENEEYLENNYGFFPFPALEEGEGDPTSVVGTVGDNYYHISESCEYKDEAFDFLTYLLDEEGIAARIESGRIPPIAGVSEMIDDPLLAEVLARVEEAGSVQLWYDQYLPAQLGEVHKDTMQALFGLALTPEEAAAAQEEATAEFYDS